MVRLVDGDFVNEGRVEVYCNGVWGTVCGHNFSSSDRRIICHQLGYSQAFSDSDLLISRCIKYRHRHVLDNFFVYCLIIILLL